ncbi:MAG TPA: DUF438 domain-containing protein [Clostridiaceae bacterium]|nr:DUF438 domain-containing protein [Clostridiaceae bacterium]
MSEVINNREYRQKVLKELIMELHNGKSVEEVKPRFEKLIKGISPSEISEMENALIMEGMPLEHVQKLCDVHAAVFKGSIEEIHSTKDPSEIPGHPLHTFKMENREIEKLINERIKPHLAEFKNNDNGDIVKNLLEDFNLLLEVRKHYSRKENLLFPYLEKYGIMAPPKVMWGVDDEIRAGIKEVISQLSDYKGDRENVADKIEDAVNRVLEMIFKEENILFPMAIESLSEDEWLKIARESDEIGYCLTMPQETWKPERVNIEQKMEKEGLEKVEEGYVKFETGTLTYKEIECMLNTLPFDITFVDKDGIVKYFSQGKERIFARTKAVIGRTVQNCHPPASIHAVEQVVDDLRSGRKDHVDFWIQMGDVYALIRYFAVRNNKGEFLGILEVTQNIKPIKDIKGEKRLI